MKLYGIGLITVLFIIQNFSVNAQCTGGTSAGSITPSGAFQTVCILGGNYRTFNAVAGSRYLFTFCQGGASAGFDTEITIVDNTSGAAVAGYYNDDYCGTGSELTFLAPSTATYRVLITQYGCGSTAACATLAYRRLIYDDPCHTYFLNPRCASASQITFSNSGATSTATPGAPGCAVGYSGGDIWLSSIVPYSGQITITSTAGTLTDAEMAVYRGTCSSLTSLGCDDNAGPGSMPQLSLTGLTPGDSIFIRIYDKANNQVGTFTVGVIDSDPYYCMTGSATQIFPGGCIEITPDIQNQNATVWNQTQINLSQYFDYAFVVNLGGNDAGADGLAFTMQNSAAGMNALGNPGYQLGIAPVSNSVIIEFDTFNNGAGVSDIAADHTAISLNGNIGAPVAGPIQASATSTNIEDGANHTVRVTWNPTTQTLSVYFDGSLRLTYTGDLVNTVFGGSNLAYWGFSGSTGAYKNRQYICPGNLPGAPMPVEWKSLEAVYENEQVDLVWETSSEIKTKEFIIERNNGDNFEAIGSVPASGNASSLSAYNWSDLLPVAGMSYYRIKQVDLDGTYSFSQAKVVYVEGENDLSFNVYPNPARFSHELVVELSNINLSTRFILYNSQGVECFNTEVVKGKNSITLPGSLTPGLYHAVVKTSSQSLDQSIVITE